MDQWVNLAKDTGANSIIGVLLVLVLGTPAVLSSETVKKKFGALVFLPRLKARWKREALEEDTARETAAVDALNARIESLMRTAAEDKKWMQQRIDSLRAELDATERENDARMEALQDELSTAMDYIVFVTDWARRVVVWAEAHGYELPPPPWRNFYEWEAEHKPYRGKYYPREPPDGRAHGA